VPSTATLYWDGTNTMVDDGGICGLEPATLVVR
jgi:hypothetical protein